MMDIAIVCGGLSTRLGSLTKNIPKSLIDIEGRPFIYYQLKLLEKNEFTHVVLCVNNFGDKIEKYVKTLKLNMYINFSYDGHYALRTGGAIKNALPHLGDKFFVLYGDSYLPIEYKKIEDYYKNQCNKLSLMTTYRNENPIYKNNVLIDIKNGNIIEYDKKLISPQNKHIDYGLGAFKKETFERFPFYGFDLSLIYKSLIRNNELANFEVSQKFYEIGSFDGIEEFKKYIRENDEFC